MEANTSPGTALNYSVLSKTTNSSDNQAKSKIHLQPKDKCTSENKYNKETQHNYCKCEIALRGLKSGPTWVEGYGKYLDLDTENFLRDAPIVESRDKISKVSFHKKTRKRQGGKFVRMCLEKSFIYALKI